MKIVVVDGVPKKVYDSLSEADLSEEDVVLEFRKVEESLSEDIIAPKKSRRDRRLQDVFVRHDRSNIRKMGRRH